MTIEDDLINLFGKMADDPRFNIEVIDAHPKIIDLRKRNTWLSNELMERNTEITDLKDKNIEGLKELYDYDQKEISRLKYTISARDLTIKSLTSMCQSTGKQRSELDSVIADLESKIVLKDKALDVAREIIDNSYRLTAHYREQNEALEAELSARKGDSEALMKVVDVVKRWNDERIISRPAMNQIAYIIKEYLDAPEPPMEEELKGVDPAILLKMEVYGITPKDGKVTRLEAAVLEMP